MTHSRSIVGLGDGPKIIIKVFTRDLQLPIIRPLITAFVTCASLIMTPTISTQYPPKSPNPLTPASLLKASSRPLENKIRHLPPGHSEPPSTSKLRILGSVPDLPDQRGIPLTQQRSQQKNQKTNQNHSRHVKAKFRVLKREKIGIEDHQGRQGHFRSQNFKAYSEVHE